MTTETPQSQRVGITKLVIDNFRGIKHREFDFTDPQGQPLKKVVLAGPNGCGKTSVMEACLYALGTFGSPSLGKRKVLRGVDDDTSISGVMQVGNVPIPFLLRPPRIVEPGYTSADHPALLARQGFAYFGSSRKPVASGPVHPAGDKITYDPRNSIKAIKQDVADSKLFEFVGQGLAQRASETSMLERLTKSWSRFHPEKNGRFGFGPVGDTPQEGFDVFLYEGGEKICSLDDLSSGELEVLNFAGWAIGRKFDRGVVFIDEPELHLHPEWHGAIMPALADLLPNAQIIVATHSPEIYDQAMSFERFLLVDDDDPRSDVWRKKHENAPWAAE